MATDILNKLVIDSATSVMAAQTPVFARNS